MRHGPSQKLLLAATIAVMVAVLVTANAACGSDGASTTSAGGGGSSTSAAGPVQELTVSAASSLKGAFTEIGKAFDAANNAKTTINFDASGTLQRQIEAGAPVDVFASAAMKQVQALLDKGLVDDGSVQTFAGNSIALVVPADSGLELTGFQDLTRDDVEKIAYGDPKVAPHGVAAEEILGTLGILDQVKPKVVYASNASQTLAYVSGGEVDAGIVFGSEAETGGDRVKTVATADPGWYSPVAYPIVIVGASEAKDLGRAFVDFVFGPTGQAILADHGFLPPPDR